jgi:hypothetical protein
MSRYAHYEAAGWIERNQDITCSDLGCRAAYIISVAFGGIYNAPIEHKFTQWTSKKLVDVICVSRVGVATFDRDELTKIVLLAHELCVRVEVDTILTAVEYPEDPEDAPSRAEIVKHTEDAPWADGFAPHLRLRFSPRDRNADTIYDRHPDIDQAVAEFRKWFDDSARNIATARAPEVVG